MERNNKQVGEKMYSYEEIYGESLKYFNGDELALTSATLSTY